MLQQTQVPRVIPRWHAFLHRFPDPATCAAAPTSDVIDAWAGLGYNRRAVALQRAAVAAVADHDGRLPADLAGLLSLPGVGPYTARAVLAFAAETDVGVVDTNAARVLARAVAGRRLGRAEVQRVADDLVPAGRGWSHNQAVLDLGSGWCRARPRCERCPLESHCRWRRAGCPAPDPADGTAGTQSTFAGSDRQGRGRLVTFLRSGPVAPSDLAGAAGWPDDPGRAARVAADLVADGLAVVGADGALALPGSRGVLVT